LLPRSSIAAQEQLKLPGKAPEMTAQFVFEDWAALERAVGTEIARSPWITITQGMIDEFAELTGDRQWIHVDPVRAKRESPFGNTVAHGFLTLSLLSQLSAKSLALPPAKLRINYGFDRVRFISPVLVDSEIQATFSAMDVQHTADGLQVTWGVEVRARDAAKPALAATWLSRIVL